MPSRKQGSGETGESRRASLHRLSSIASLPNLFNRRKSTANNSNAADTAASNASSSSNISLSSSTIANAPEPLIRQVANATTTAILQQREDGTVAELPGCFPTDQPQPAEKRSSHICLPDDPIGGMPRSRTFSNLPIPSQAKKFPQLGPAHSHTRLSSAALPYTRLPSPSASTRKHSHTRLASVGGNAPPPRNRVKRSDTEPWLSLPLSTASLPPRSTAFKENITLSPVKMLPPMHTDIRDGQYSSLVSSTAYPSEIGWQPYYPAESTFTSDWSSSGSHIQHPALPHQREYKSSPVYRSSKVRPPTPGGSKTVDLQRWISQPVLRNTTNISNNAHSAPRDIKQTRLLSARQAPTPQPPRTPLTAQPTLKRRLKSVSNSGHIRRTSIQTPTQARPFPDQPPQKIVTTDPEPPDFWLGRLSSLADRYRHEELISHLACPKSPSKSETDKMHTPEANSARMRRALEHLYATCGTAEARESLETFQLQYADVTGCPELAIPIVLDTLPQEDEGDGFSEARKTTFVDRLFGRQKRRSLVLV